MATTEQEDSKIDVNFESHPPIAEDLNGIAALLKQTLLHFVDCQSLAKHLIEQKDVTQVIVQEATDEEDSKSDDDETDDNIYAVSSVIDLSPGELPPKDDKFVDCCKQLLKLFKDKCPKFKEQIEKADKSKFGFVVNERYINLSPQLSLPIFKSLAKSIEGQGFTHLIFLSKILVRSRNTDTKLPSKKSKSGHSREQETEALVFVNQEEEVICEQSDHYADFDVSAHCDENASWSFSSDIKYIPHRRVVVMDYKNWPKTLECLEKELN